MQECEIEFNDFRSEDLNALSTIASTLIADEISAVEDIKLYKLQVQEIYDSINSDKRFVLSGLLVILIEGLDKLISEDKKLNLDECKFLKKIPDILSEYILIPTSKIPDAHLLCFLANTNWVRPVTRDEEKTYRRSLIGQSPAHKTAILKICGSEPNDNDTKADESVNYIDLNLTKINEVDYSNLSNCDELKENIKLYESKSKLLTEAEDTIDLVELTVYEDIDIQAALYESDEDSISEVEEIDLTILAQNEDIDAQAALYETGEGSLNEKDVIDCVGLSVNKNIDVQDEFYESKNLFETSVHEEVIDISELSLCADNDDQAALYESEENESRTSNNDDMPIVSEKNIAITNHNDKLSSDNDSNSLFFVSDDQRELIDLIIGEIEGTIKNETSLNIEDSAAIKSYLTTIVEQLEKISNAIELIGLEGLVHVCSYLSTNLNVQIENNKALTFAQQNLIENWPMMLMLYLNNIASSNVSDKIINYLTDENWPEPVSGEAKKNLELLLKNPQIADEEKKLRQETASADDMSLALPEDVNPELLEGLLQDLPVQSEEFSSAIQNLTDHKDLSYLEIAQRIAHTLKGAGNVVGVKGIANLTHHLEDILEIQSKANKIPSTLLLSVLTDAADCLETMTEALLGIDEAPDNALSVFQSILDWANKLDVEGATEFIQNDIADEAQTKNEEKHSADLSEGIISQNSQDIDISSKKSINVENMLRVPASIADDLLRLAGENLISTSQIQEYIKTIQSRHINLKTHNQTLQQLSFDLEHIVDVQGIASNINRQVTDGDFDPLELDQYHELHSMSRRLVEIAADSIELADVLVKDITQLNGLVINQDRLQKENEKLVLKTRMVPTKTITPRLKRGVKQACRLTNKEADIEILDNDTYMDSEILNSLIEPLMHILRNSVDHGIESEEERKQENKSDRGSIKLVFSRKGDHIVIDIKDDGKGLSLNKIRKKAMSMGLVSSQSEITEANLKKYILQPGFSTSTEVSQVSGRGIGLDVVHNKIRELKGSIEISSVEGKGCHFSISLPVSSFSVHSLLVRARNIVYAFSNRGIAEVLYPGLGDIENIGNDKVFKLGDQVYKTTSIEALLKMPEDRRSDEREFRPIILVKDDSGSTTAIQVQELVDSRDVVVKSMGSYIPKIQGVIGATVLGDGSIAPVIDLPELIQSGSGMVDQIIHNISDSEINIESVAKPPYVLVVDDSLSARKSLAQFVQDLGLEVRTARDGLEAVTLIDARKPGLVLVDMEMPGMNGLELTSYIRSSDNTRHMPVIMITSRSTDKHRQVAMDKGVDHYMVKPFLEDELASHINTSLKIA